MPITARQTTNLNPQEQEGMLSSPSQVISSGSPGFIGGGTTQSPEYSVKGGEQTRSGMFTNIQDYLRANEGAAAPIVGKFEQEATKIVDPLQKERTNVETGLSGLQKNIETAKSGLQSNLAQQQSLKGILGTAKTDPTKLSTEQIQQFRTGISSYGTPDVSKTISEFAPQKTDIFGKQADVLSQARTAQSQLQPMGEISGVKGLIRRFDPGTRTTAGGSSLDAFITRQAPEYQKFTQDLQTKLSDVAGTEAKLTPYSKAIQDYLGTGEGSLSNIGSQFDPTLKTGTAFQTQAESLAKTPTKQVDLASYSPSDVSGILNSLNVLGYDKEGNPMYANPEIISRGGQAFQNRQIFESKVTDQIKKDLAIGNLMSEEEKKAYINRAKLAGISDQQISKNLSSLQIPEADVSKIAEKVADDYKNKILGGATVLTAGDVAENERVKRESFLRDAIKAAALNYIMKYQSHSSPSISLEPSALAPVNAAQSFAQDIGSLFQA